MSVPPVTVVVSPAGRVTTPPATIRQNLVIEIQSEVPDFTDNLPGSLIEDVVSTDVAALVVCDSAVTESINCLTPLASNPYTLAQQGILYGIPLASSAYTSVYVVFSGTSGFIINPGFLVSDGTYQYSVVDGGVIGSGGTSQPLYCQGTIAGPWGVPAGTVTTIVTSVPIGFALTCTNPLDGIPSAGNETEAQYRVRVLQAGAAPTAGAQSWAKTLIGKVPGVQVRLVSLQQQSPGWKVIVGGGDPYDVAQAVWQGLGDISNLQPSVLGVSAITKANPGVVTTNLNHGFTTGQTGIAIAGVLGMTAANGGPYTVTVLDEKRFSFGVDTTGFGTYTSGGVVTPNGRNVSINLYDYPDTYTVPLVIPPLQTVQINLTWNTTSPFIVNDSAVAQAGAPALANYVNGVAVGQPLNGFELQNTFQLAVANLIPTALLTRMVFTVSINSISTSPVSGTEVILGDPESYFSTTASLINITQG